MTDETKITLADIKGTERKREKGDGIVGACTRLTITGVRDRRHEKPTKSRFYSDACGSALLEQERGQNAVDCSSHVGRRGRIFERKRKRLVSNFGSLLWMCHSKQINTKFIKLQEMDGERMRCRMHRKCKNSSRYKHRSQRRKRKRRGE